MTINVRLSNPRSLSGKPLPGLQVIGGVGVTVRMSRSQRTYWNLKIRGLTSEWNNHVLADFELMKSYVLHSNDQYDAMLVFLFWLNWNSEHHGLTKCMSIGRETFYGENYILLHFNAEDLLVEFGRQIPDFGLFGIILFLV